MSTTYPYLPHALLPAQAPPPFPEPKLRAARRVQGLVFTPPPHHSSSASSSSAAAHHHHAATSLERRSSVAGNILLIDMGDDGNNKNAETFSRGSPFRAYMLQRKIKNTRFGSIRVGYALRAKSDEGEDSGAPSSATAWEVATNDSGVGGNGDGTTTIEDATELVAVTIKEKSKVLWDHGGEGGGSGSPPNTAQDPKSELSAMQLVASLEHLDIDRGGHVVGTNLIAADDAHVYIVTPFCKEGSLFDYCMRQKRLPEVDARFFFRQILKALETLQLAEICHRDVNLQNILLSGSTCTLMNLSCALRIPIDPETGAPMMIEPQPPCATNPQTVAPEILRNEPFDGYAADLWAAGVALFTMLLGSDALFAAPVPEDRTFRRICEGNLRELIQEIQYGRHGGADRASDERSSSHPGLSDGAVDLLQRMLRPESRLRLTLAQVLNHEWVVGNDAVGDDSTSAGSVPNVPTRRFSSFMMED